MYTVDMNKASPRVMLSFFCCWCFSHSIRCPLKRDTDNNNQEMRNVAFLSMAKIRAKPNQKKNI